MQKNAFENQILWYEDRLKEHPNWHLASDSILTYLDYGKSGTKATTRPGFMKMIEDAKAGKFDMIATREVSRFARNQADTYKYLEELRKCNVQVYFINENLKTLGSEADEIRFAVYASMAQAESRKISERVRAGQESSRKKGVMFGNGNILGYKRVRLRHDSTADPDTPTFAVVPEQAETVRKIFEWCAEGNGLRQIVNMLEKEGRKTATGLENWMESSVLRCLRNPMYIGKQKQCQTRVGHFLDGVRERCAENVIVEGDFEAIVSEELFDKVQRILDEKASKRENELKDFREGRRSQDKWGMKLECSCGSRFRRDPWGKTKDSVTYGYTCRTKASRGSTEYREREGLSTADSCDRKGIPAWHLEMVALMIFRAVCGTQYQSILDTYQSIEDNYTLDETTASDMDLKKIESEIKKLENQINMLLDLYLDGSLNEDTFKDRNSRLEKELETWKDKRRVVETLASGQKNYLEERKNDDLVELLETMTRMFNFHGETIDADFVKHYVDKVVIRSDHCYEWMINLSGDAENFEEKTKLWACAAREKKVEQTKRVQEEYYTDMFTFPVRFDEAREYRKRCGRYLRSNQWDDLLIQVFVRS